MIKSVQIATCNRYINPKKKQYINNHLIYDFTYKSYAKSGKKKLCIIIIIASKGLNIHIHEINRQYLVVFVFVNTLQ